MSHHVGLVCDVPQGDPIAQRTISYIKLSLMQAGEIGGRGTVSLRYGKPFQNCLPNSKPLFELIAIVPPPLGWKEEWYDGPKGRQYVRTYPNVKTAFEMLEKIFDRLMAHEPYQQADRIRIALSPKSLKISRTFTLPPELPVESLHRDFEQAYGETIRESTVLSTLAKNSK